MSGYPIDAEAVATIRAIRDALAEALAEAESQLITDREAIAESLEPERLSYALDTFYACAEFYRFDELRGLAYCARTALQREADPERLRSQMRFLRSELERSKS